MAIRRTYSNAGLFLQQHNKRIDQLGRSMIKPIAQVLKDEYNAIALSELGRGSYNSVTSQKELNNVLSAGLLRAGSAMAKDTNRLIQAATQTKKRNDDFEFESIEGRISTIMTGYVGRKIKLISAATFDQVRGRIGRLRLDGSTIDDMINDIQNYSTSVSLYRAHVIVRTEASAAAHLGQLLASEASEFDTAREWISTNDDRTRSYAGGEFDHTEADGQIANGSDGFDVSGETLLHPCDPSGSAGNVINCRCGTGVIIL
jgi:hypothetical protein